MEALRGRCLFVSGMWMPDCSCYGTLQTTLITMFGCNRGELQYQACASYFRCRCSILCSCLSIGHSSESASVIVEPTFATYAVQVLSRTRQCCHLRARARKSRCLTKLSTGSWQTRDGACEPRIAASRRHRKARCCRLHDEYPARREDQGRH